MELENLCAYGYDIAPATFREDFPVVLLSDNVIDDVKVTSVHIHDFLELGFCHQGEGIFVIGNKVLSFRAGDAVIITGHEAHRAQSRKGSSSTWSWVYLDHTALLTGFCLDYSLLDCSGFWGEGFHNIFSPPHSRDVNDAIQRIVDVLREQGPQYQRVTRALVLYLMTLLHRNDRSKGATQDADRMPHLQRVREALTFISSQYTERIEIGELADLCNMSIPNFRRIFFKATGRNPLDYLMHLRLTMACIELKSTGKSAETIAADTGFPTFSCFLRKFKTVYGTTPHKWRKQ